MVEKKFGDLLIRFPKIDEKQLSYSLVLASFCSKMPPSNLILDIGTGVGLCALSLATIFSHAKIIGIEMRREYVRFAAHNVKSNGLQHSIEVFFSHFLSPPPRIAAGTFSFVVSQIPSLKTLQEIKGSVELWVRFCLLMMKSLGTIVFLCPIEHLQSFFIASYEKLGDIRLIPLWDNKKTSSFLLIYGIKGGKNNTQLEAGQTVIDG